MTNLVTRTISGIVFLGILLSGIIFHPFGFGAVFLFITVVGLHEFYSIMRVAKFARIFGYITAVALFVLFFFKGLNDWSSGFCKPWFLLLVLPVAALFISGLYYSDKTGSDKIATSKPFDFISRTLAGIIYVALPFSLNTELTFKEGNYDYHILLSLFIILWCNDVGAYCFGSLFGRKGKHKLFERISPKKSWEGFFGGLIASFTVACILSALWGDRYGFAAVHWYALAAIVVVFATFGDLVESMLKRGAGAKDSGHIIPGHGGILDRFDGSLTAFPCALAYISIFNIL